LSGDLLSPCRAGEIRAAQERTTIGELIEQWIADWKP
jgi:hypothetical protein